MSKSKSTCRKRISELLLAACLFSALLIPSAQATPGALDPSFGTGGKVTTAFGSHHDGAGALVLQPDGKLVAAGESWNVLEDDFALARYNPDGSLDTNFNGTGKVTTPIGSSDDYADALVLQPDGKLVAAGGSSNGPNDHFALARYNPDGSLDTNFKGTGKVTTVVGADDWVNALVLQPDGKLVAAGVSYQGSNSNFALARYNPDGSLDTTFHGTGMVTTPIGSGNAFLYALVLQPDGKLVAAGDSWNGSNYVFALARYNPDGSLDTSFKGTGKVTTAIGPGDDQANALVLQPDGKLVTAGSGYNGSDFDFALVRYLDSSTLTVAKSGSGSGSVTSSPNGVDCGATCSASFAAGPVTLTATPSPGSSFLGWSGDCSGTGSCTLSLNADQTATARFESDKRLTLAKAGTGTGSVGSSPAGISCGSGCASSFAYGTTVTLTASPAAGSAFAGWSGGGCSGAGSCTLTMSADQTTTASFNALCVVPKLKGKTLRAAKLAIKRAHCSVGKVTRAFSAKVKKGRVLSQKPKPGTKLAAGAKVRFTLSKGKKT